MDTGTKGPPYRHLIILLSAVLFLFSLSFLLLFLSPRCASTHAEGAATDRRLE